MVMISVCTGIMESQLQGHLFFAVQLSFFGGVEAKQNNPSMYIIQYVTSIAELALSRSCHK